MGWHRSKVICHFDVENGASRVESLHQLLNGKLVNASFLFYKLFVKLILKLTVQVKILNWCPLIGFLKIWFNFEFSLEIELRNTFKILLQSAHQRKIKNLALVNHTFKIPKKQVILQVTFKQIHKLFQVGKELLTKGPNTNRQRSDQDCDIKSFGLSII